MSQLVTTSSGIVLAVETSGREPGGATGCPVVVVPGWCCDRRSVAPLVQRLGERHRVLLVDLPGHGGSPRSSQAGEAGASVAAMADAVLGAVEATGLGRAVVVGHSMGGLVALVAAANPDRVAASVLLDPAPVVAAPGKDYFARSVVEVAADVDGAWRRRFAERLLLPGTPRRAEVVEVMGAFPVALAAAELAAMADLDGRTALAGVRVPVLVVTAGAVEPEIVELLPSVALGRVVGSGHFVQLDVPDQVAAMVERFLEVTVASQP